MTHRFVHEMTYRRNVDVINISTSENIKTSWSRFFSFSRENRGKNYMSLQKEEKETFSEEICDNYLLSMTLFIYIFFYYDHRTKCKNLTQPRSQKLN